MLPLSSFGSRRAQQLLATRIRCCREQADMTQAEFAEASGFASHQIVSQIETAQRAIAADELVKMATVLETTVPTLLDPFVLGSEAEFFWTGTSLDHAKHCEMAVAKPLGFYRAMRWQNESAFVATREVLSLRADDGEDDVVSLAESYGRKLSLGSRPSQILYETISGNPALPIVATPTGLSVFSGVCMLSEFSAIVINSEECAALRSYALAARVFDCMTWHIHRPQNHLVGARFQPGRVSNYLARSFAAALLLPRDEMVRQWKISRVDRVERNVHEIAAEMCVPVQVVIDRAAQLRMIIPKVKQRLLEKMGVKPTPSRKRNEPRCPRVSKLIMEACAKAIEDGEVSVRKLADILGITIDDLQEEFELHRLTPPFDL